MNDEQARNFKWISSHYSDLAKQYNNKWIAVLDEKVIETADSATALQIRINIKLKQEKERAKNVIMDFITDRRFPSHDV